MQRGVSRGVGICQVKCATAVQRHIGVSNQRRCGRPVVQCPPGRWCAVQRGDCVSAVVGIPHGQEVVVGGVGDIAAAGGRGGVAHCCAWLQGARASWAIGRRAYPAQGRQSQQQSVDRRIAVDIRRTKQTIRIGFAGVDQPANVFIENTVQHVVRGGICTVCGAIGAAVPEVEPLATVHPHRQDQLTVAAQIDHGLCIPCRRHPCQDGGLGFRCDLCIN